MFGVWCREMLYLSPVLEEPGYVLKEKDFNMKSILEQITLLPIRLFRRGVNDLGELRGELIMPLWTLYMNPTKGF